MKMSRRFVAHVRSELAKGHRLQSSEKVWGAAAHALKAIAIQRGWHHRGHDLMYGIATQLPAERGRPDLAARFGYTESHHRNFIPKSVGGEDDMVNRAPLCSTHNQLKSARDIELQELRTEVAERKEFKPGVTSRSLPDLKKAYAYAIQVRREAYQRKYGKPLGL